MNKFIVTIHRKDQVLSREVNKDSFTMGRSLDCDLSLNDTNISRVHVVVSRRWNQIWIEDKNSSNGTYINGTRIVQGTPVNVVPSDRIQLGRSEYILNVDLELEQPAPEPEPEPEPSYQPTPQEEGEDAPLEATVAMPAPNMAPFQAEKILHEAKRKAAQIILEGETQAEKRVQVIYQKAREAQAQAEIFYQARMAEAHKEADAILTDFQKQGQTLLHEARNMAQELREEVDSYVQSLRQKAKKDAEEIVSEGTLAAEKMKDEALASGRDLARQESQELLKTTREEADRILDFSKLQIEETQARIRGDLEKSQQEIQLTLQNAKEDAERMLEESSAKIRESEAVLREESERIRNENKDLVQAAKAEAEQMIQTAEQKVSEIQSVSSEKQTVLNELLENVAARTAELQKVTEDLNKTRTDNSDLLSQVEKGQALLKELQTTHADLEKQKALLEASLKSLQEKQAHLTMDVHDIESKKTHLFKEYDAQKIFLNEKLEKEKSQMARSEEERLEELRLEMSKKMQKMERDLLDDVIRKKSSMVKEIHSAIEKEVVMLMEPEKWRNISQSVENHITEAIEGKVATLSQSSMTEKPVDLMKKRKNEKVRWVTMGLAMGAIGYFVSQVVINKVIRDQTPMQTMVSNEAKKRQDELEKRRFNPAQADEVKDTYTDAVIYTRNYLDIYTDAQFQQKLYKAASAYLLKTWRVDEDKSIQVISASSALVKELAEKRTKIHPDFIKEGIEKMRELEGQTLTRMKTTLGSEVRLESYRRFEKNFYMEEVKRRRMANY
ncbi:FHA domain-containing protein [Bdellovibrio bacteriovorus]|uniref:FHA domain-containing protein n=1 Tax=Bdellovibrio bacteriovorus TaxID=959 RepID=UPI0021CE84D1|nr:FHA domain-containing protein [Bdellovibrio bacteriovorus]UXR65097.1 FHA domain-containing protein [Bdellovibrio bacteriovorus]